MSQIDRPPRFVNFLVKVFKKTPRISWQKATEEVQEEWEKGERLDRWGIQLGQFLFTFSLLFILLLPLWIKDPTITIDFSYIFFSTVIVFLSLFIKVYFRFIRKLSLYIGEDFAGAVAFAFAVAFVAVAFVAVAGAGAFAVAGAVAGVVVVVVAGLLGSIYLEFFLGRADKAQNLAEKNKESISKSDIEKANPEIYSPRQKPVFQIQQLLHKEEHFTAGLAGRRGLGKTNLLHLINKLTKEKSLQNTETHSATPGDPERPPLNRITFFLRTPTEFSEIGFLSALLQQFAQGVNRHIAPRLGQNPYEVERELREKRRYLRYAHSVQGILIFLLIAGAVFLFWSTERPDWMLQTFRVQEIPLERTLKPVEPPSLLYLAKRDSLAQQFLPQLRENEDSLLNIYHLLTRYSSQMNQDSVAQMDSVHIDTFISQLISNTGWPDSAALSDLKSELKHADSLLNPIRMQEARYNSMVHFLDSTQTFFDKEAQRVKSDITWEVGSFYAWFLLFTISLCVSWWQTREKKKRPEGSGYVSARQLNNLNERTITLIERLQYQMTFGEGQESGVTAQAPKSFLGLSFKRSRSITREMRPFTILSLTEEYRRFMQDVIIYLNDAIQSEVESSTEAEEVKIIIAIDELDKVLDIKRLHEMLKSIKAIFEIPNVYYLLSISEDALETYRLRHLETKNEIDSAFTHIFSIPPMDAATSLTFFAEADKKLNKALFPAAIVFGGGVPRDMHRLLQLLSITPQHETLEACLNALWKDDCQAAADVLKQNPKLSDEWKKKWVAKIEGLNCKTVSEVEAVIDEVGKLTLNTFTEENPSPEPEARQVFHHLRSLVRSMAIKRYIYAQTENLNTRRGVETWKIKLTELSLRNLKSGLFPDNVIEELKSIENNEFMNEEDFLKILKAKIGEKLTDKYGSLLFKNFRESAEVCYYESLSKNKEIDKWLTKLEPLRKAVFELSNNPLGVWEALKQAEKQTGKS
jgi:hypothetical protein